MLKHEVENEYFDWLYNLVCGERYSSKISYRKLFIFLHKTEFTWTIPMDENRAHDGIDLRRRFSLEQGYEGDYFADYIEGPCSVLEMMIALAIRCEENIMDDPRFGDRTSQWFWEMVKNLGLSAMTDERFNRLQARDVIDTLLDRDYEPDGSGGLFRIRHCSRDLRKVEIWYQLCWYLDSIT